MSREPDDPALVLQDGTTVRVRPLRPDDGQRLLGMWERTSAESRRRRFQGFVRIDESNVDRFVSVDPEEEIALAAVLGRGEDEQMIAVGRLVRTDVPGDAEFALLVEDQHQGRGIGTGLLRRLAQRAKDEGITTLSSEVLAENSPMLRIIEDLGLRRVGRDRDSGVVHTDLAVDLGDDFLRVGDEADRTASIAAVGRFLRPERIAVVGASRDRGSIGGLVFANLLAGGFDGAVYPVNAESPHVQGVAAYRSLGECPAVPDLVVVCVPAARATAVVEEAGALGVRAVVVISAGFAEAGPEGRERQHELMEVARSHGLRVVGPNCMGVLNGAADARVNATFSDTFPRPGGVAMSSQSGALGLAVLDHVDALGLGISSFVSVGNTADITTNDLLHYWSEDPTTDVVLLYLESFDEPRTFSRIARRLSRRTPVVAVKSGRTSGGRRAASSHTAAVTGGDVATEALFRQTGIIRTDTLQEMFDVALLLEQQPLPRGPRVGIVTNAGGPGILVADACETRGLVAPRLSAGTLEALREAVATDLAGENPVDLVANATAAAYRAATSTLAASGEVDALVVIHIPAGTSDTTAIGEAIVAAAEDVPEDVPLLSVFGSHRGVHPALAPAGVPSFAFPEDAASALGRVWAYASWRDRPLGSVVRPDDLDPSAAAAVVEAALRRAPDDDGRALIGHAHGTALTGSTARHDPSAARSAADGVWLSHVEAQRVIAAYGVPVAPARLVTDPDDAAAFQRQQDAPVVVKLAAPIHKTDVGGIALDLRTPEEAADAVRRLRAHLVEQGLDRHAEQFLVQEMVTDGIEMVVGITDDPSFGPLLVTGMGGTLVELVRDVSVRVTPVTDRDVEEMLDQLRMKPLLEGYRGSPPADVAALTDLLHRIGALVEDVPEVVELDCNPVFVRPDGEGVVAVDVRIRVAPRG